MEVETLAIGYCSQELIGDNTLRAKCDISSDSCQMRNIGSVLALDLPEHWARIAFSLVIKLHWRHVGCSSVFPASEQLECGIEQVSFGRSHSVVVVRDVEKAVALLDNIQKVLPIPDFEESDLSLGLSSLKLLPESKNSLDCTVIRVNISADYSLVVSCGVQGPQEAQRNSVARIKQ